MKVCEHNVLNWISWLLNIHMVLDKMVIESFCEENMFVNNPYIHDNVSMKARTKLLLKNNFSLICLNLTLFSFGFAYGL